MKNLNYLMDHILYQIFKVILNNLKKHEKVTDNPSIRIYINKIENRITFKIKTGYYLELLTPERMKLLRSTRRKITKDENGENVPCLEITQVALVHCNIVNNNYESLIYNYQESYIHLFLINQFWTIIRYFTQ